MVTLVGVLVLGMGLMVYEPIIPIGLGLAGIAVGVGGTHLWRALSEADGERTRSETTTPEEPTTERDPVDILKTRYARGDLDDEAFERRIERLVELGSDDSRADRTDDVRVRER